MLNQIISYSVRNKLLIILGTIGIIGIGLFSLNKLPIDAVPDITNNQVQIITSSPSQSALDIERLVTFPVEQTMATIPGIEELRSFSRFGLSVVTIVFKDNIDIYWARQQVNERLNQAKALIPDQIGSPEMAPVSTGLGEIYQYVIHAKNGYEEKYDERELRTIQDWVVRRQLLGVEGIADVSSFGGKLKQYQIALNSALLNRYEITLSEIFEALEKNNQNTGGAYIEKNSSAYFIKTEGLYESISDIENTCIRYDEKGSPLLMKDISKISIGESNRYGALTRNESGEVVGAIVLMLKGANAFEVIQKVKARIKQIQKTLPEGVVIEPFLDRTNLVNKTIKTVRNNLLEGALIVIFVLVLMLGNLRAGLIVASVIPLAMLFAVSLMNVFGVSGNLMSLGAVDFGIIVDGAVIIVEATLHFLSQSGTKRLTQKEMDAQVYEAASKISKSASFGTLIILIVYLPILALSGVEGKMFVPMALTVTFAIMGAYLLSLTYVPVVSSLFLSKKIQDKENLSDRFLGLLKQKYKVLLSFVLEQPKLVISSALILLGIAYLIFTKLGAEFIPSLDEGDFAVEVRLMTGSSLSETIKTTTKASGILRKRFPEIKETIGKIGSAEIPTDPMPIEACDLMLILKERSNWTSATSKEELAKKMKDTLEKYLPGVSFGFQQPIQMRFNELMTGARQDVVLKIYGEDLLELSKYAQETGKIINQIAGAEDIYIEELTGLPQINVQFDRIKLAHYGVDITVLNQTINTALAGQSAGYFYEGEKRFDLVLRYDQESRKQISEIEKIPVPNQMGKMIPLAQLAQIEIIEGPNQIQRDDAKRRVIVGFNVRGRDVEMLKVS